MNDSTPDKTKLSWWRRLSSGLKRTSSSLGSAVGDLATKRKLDRAMLDDIEDVLLRADLGTEVAARIATAVGVGRYDKAITADDVKSVVATEVEKVLVPVARPLEIDASQKPFVILVVGVNGSGKTTTIGKLAAKLTAEGPKVDAGRRRYFPRRRDRAVEDLGRAHQIARSCRRPRLGFREPCLQRPVGGAREKIRCAAGRHRRPAAEQGRTDERA